MRVIGLTGGIGMGKSTAADLLRNRGVPVVDTDVIARQVVEPGQPALAQLASTFGEDIIGTDGRLRREKLARRVFADPDARKQLEAILHPRIRAIWTAQVTSWRAEGKALGVVVIPLLFETNAAAQFDATICVACAAVSQRERLQARGWTRDQIDQRIQAQLPIDKKIAPADYMIWTEAGIDVHAEQLDRIVAMERNSASSE